MKDEQVHDRLPFMGFADWNPPKAFLKVVQAFFCSDILSGDVLGFNLETRS
jgi:hypothetical protein